MEEYLTHINNLYSENLVNHGISSKAVGWKDSESQNLRFTILNNVLRDKDDPISVNDYGCGYGAHLSNLLNSGWKVTSYNAYDINSNMLEKLTEIHKNVKNCIVTPFASPEISTVADYSLVSGTFNVLPNDDITKWEDSIRENLNQLKNFSTKGFAFNLLSTYVDWKADGLYYGDPLFWFNYCKTEISKQVTLYHDYDLFEWTIVCRFVGKE